MIFEDTYQTIKSVSTAIYKEKGSKFVAEAIPVKSEEEAKSHLAEKWVASSFFENQIG